MILTQAASRQCKKCVSAEVRQWKSGGSERSGKKGKRNKRNERI